MKKTLLATLLAAAAVVPFSAQAQQTYAGVSAGQANNSVSDGGFVATSRSEKKTAFKVYIGHDFSKNWGVELGYADFGNVRNVYTIGILDYRAHAIYLAGTGTLPLNDSFALTGKLGVAFNKASGTVSAPGLTARVSGSKTNVMGGIGAMYHFNKQVSATLDFEDFGSNGDVRANMWTAGVRVRF